MPSLFKRGESDMTQGVIWRELVRFAIPMALGLVFQQLYNTVDSVVVGRFVGKEALAAVGSTGNIINMLVGACAGLATGAGVIISQCYGARDHERLHAAVHTTIVVTLALSVVATLVGVKIVDVMLNFMDTPEDVYGQAKEYLTIYFWGLGGLLFYNMGSGILRAVGDSRRPLYFLGFSALVNTVLDLVFVIVFDMGVAGVAWATIIAQFLSALLVLCVLTKTTAPYAIRWRRLRVRRDLLGSIFSIGLPTSIQQAITSFSNVFVQGYINFFGSACMAGWASYNKIDVFILIPVQSIALASTTFVGQNFGAGKFARVRSGVRQALLMSLGLTAMLSALIIALARPMLTMFSQEEEVLWYGARFVTLISPFYVTICFNQIFAGGMRGMGDAKVPMAVMLFSFVVFRQLFLYVTRLLGGGFVSVALAYPMGWVLCSILMTLLFRRNMRKYACADRAPAP